MSVLSIPSVNVPKPYGWTRDTSNIKCQNDYCRYTDFGKNGFPLSSYSPGQDNGDGTVRLNFGGYCLNCLSDMDQQKDF